VLGANSTLDLSSQSAGMLGVCMISFAVHHLIVLILRQNARRPCSEKMIKLPHTALSIPPQSIEINNAAKRQLSLSRRVISPENEHNKTF